MLKLIFIRHAEPEVNKDVPSKIWEISEKGGTKAYEYLNEIKELSEINIVYSSMERKAIQTARILLDLLPGQKTEITIKKDIRLNEVDRSKGKFYADEDIFEEKVKKSLLYMEKPVITGWETAIDALRRFNEFVLELKQIHKRKKKGAIAIVSHGTVLNLYLAQVEGYISNYERILESWIEMPFCGWFVEEKNSVTRSW